MMKFEMTYHASIERADRLAACIEYLGMSKFILEAKDRRYPGTRQCLTSTGIILVVSESTGQVITGFMASMPQLFAMYRSCGYKQVPPKIYARVEKNIAKYAWILTM